MSNVDNQLIFEAYLDKGGTEGYVLANAMLKSGWEVASRVQHDRGGNFILKLPGWPITVEFLGQGPSISFIQIKWRDPYTAPEDPKINNKDFGPGKIEDMGARKIGDIIMDIMANDLGADNRIEF